MKDEICFFLCHLCPIYSGVEEFGSNTYQEYLQYFWVVHSLFGDWLSSAKQENDYLYSRHKNYIPCSFDQFAISISSSHCKSEGRLERLKSSQATSSSSHVSICHNLSGLVDLFDSVDDVLQLSQSHHGKCVEEVLDESLRLLDLCGTIRDVLSQMKEIVQKLESSLRRKRGDSGLSNEVGAYMVSRKQLNKLIYKIFGGLKRMEKSYTTTSLEKDSLSSMLREIEGISLTVFDSLLSFISQPKARSKSLSFVWKLLQSKRVSCEREADINEVEKLDINLLVLKSKRSTKDIDLKQCKM